MNYEVKYKLEGQLFWRTIKNVDGDGLVENGQARFIVQSDGSRTEIPVTACFKFSKERHLSILKGMEKEAGQKIPTEK